MTIPDGSLGDGLTCFVIGPIGSKHAPIGTPARVSYENGIQLWESVLEPACATFGLSPLRADKLVQPGEITEQIFVLLRDSDLVVADVSGGNPNVMYELGLRHTRDKATIQIGEYEKLPFDVNTIRTTQFRRTEAGLIEARLALIDVLRSALQGSFAPVTATRVWQDASPLDQVQMAQAATQSSAPDDDGDLDEDAPGFMDILAEAEVAMEALSTNLEDANAITVLLGEIAEEEGAKFASANQSGLGFAGRLNIARELAARFDEPAARLDELSADYERLVDTADLGTNYILSRVEDDPSEMDDARENLQAMVELADSSSEAAVSLTGFMHEIRDLRKIAKSLQPNSRTIERAIGRYVASADVFNRWKQRVLALPGWQEPPDEPRT